MAPILLLAAAALPSLYATRTEGFDNPLGLDARAPRLSWKIRADERDVVQASYQIQVATSEPELHAARDLVWDTGKVVSAESTFVAYAGRPLESRRRYFWQVRVWDSHGHASAWSAPAHWEIGLLSPADWSADWIEPDLVEDEPFPPAPMLRRAFRLKGNVASARVYVTSHGLYELRLNGSRVGQDLLTPGWTSYNKRLQYQTYDVTSLLKPGDNAIGAVLGSGWYRGTLRRDQNLYGTRLALLAQLEVRYADGTRETIASDARWRASTGPILMSEIYHGERYDARLEKPGWAEPGYDGAAWAPVRTAPHAKDTLISPQGPPVRRAETLRPVGIRTTPAGQQVVDMGQNMVGWVRLRVQGPRGTEVTLRHAEVLSKDGNFYTANLRAAQQAVTYVLKGDGVEVYEPHFTFQGFRYVAVDGYPGTLTPESVTGVVVHSALTKSGEFSSSNALLDQLQHNIVWGQKGNFVDVPTDCPQRDERLGWTGDAQAFCPTAAFNMDVDGFFAKWLKDLTADQLENGAVPHVIPDVMAISPRTSSQSAGAAGWADAATIVPWTMYLSYGDVRVLEDQYPSMQKWVAYMQKRAGDDLIWDGDVHFGDWLAFATTRPAYPGATTGTDMIATAFFAHSTDLLARVASVLGKPDDAARYQELRERIKTAFVHEFVTPGGRVAEGTQTAYVLALHFDLLPEALRATAAANLAREVRTRRHLTTGFLGTPYLLHVLTRYGYLAEAYLLLERKEYPSWLYPVTQGATTIWERWDGIKPDGSMQDAGMNSFNHYAYGAVGDWMYGVMAGLQVDEKAPGYKHFFVQPRPGGTITAARAAHETPYGQAASAWTLAGGRFELQVEVPPNTGATVRIPRADVARVTEGGAPLAGALGVRSSRQDGETAVVEVGSGRYRFSSAW